MLRTHLDPTKFWNQIRIQPYFQTRIRIRPYLENRVHNHGLQSNGSDKLHLISYFWFQEKKNMLFDLFKGFGYIESNSHLIDHKAFFYINQP